MDSKSNIIDLKARRKSGNSGRKNEDQKSYKKTARVDATITDISKIREEIINEERRRVKRTILTEFIGATVVVPTQGLLRISLYDISEDGIGFDMELTAGSFQVGEEVAMRVYLNNQTYFPFTVRVTHVKELLVESVYRLGARFVTDTVNKDALFHFVKFIEHVSTSLKDDRGDVVVSNLK